MGEVSRGGPVPIHSVGRELSEEERQQQMRDVGRARAPRGSGGPNPPARLEVLASANALRLMEKAS